MKIITQDNLLTHSSWWKAISEEDDTLSLIYQEDVDGMIFSLNIATLDVDAINALNKALLFAFSYEEDGIKEFNVPKWHEEFLQSIV